jgi:signal transduction histidine kinase
VEATGGADALEKALFHRPDLILLDVNLSDMDGNEVCRRLKAQPATSAIPVVQISAVRTDDVDLATAATSGADFFAPATISDDALLTIVTALLSRGARQSDVAGTANASQNMAELAHELRSPLQAMSGWLAVLRAPSIDATQRARALAAIERNIDAQTRIIEDVLDLARIGAGNLSLHLVEVNLRTILENVVSDARQQLLDKAIEIRLLCPHDIILHADAARLDRVFRNLLANAIKFSPTGGSIVMECGAAGTQASVIVRDQGVGIAADALRHVQQRYWKADAVADGQINNGLGLGLAIASRIVRLHCGTIYIDSAGPQRGVTVTVLLPTTISRASADIFH